MPKPLILISNDDGIDSPTLDLLVQSVFDIGDILVVVPATNQSSMGRSYPRLPDSGIIQKVSKIIEGVEIEAYSITTSPTMAIDHAIEEITRRKPDICLAGINPGENVGSTMTASGTVMAAIEASSYGLPAIAFSMIDSPKIDCNAVAYWCHKITANVLDQGLPKLVSALNVNFPENLSKNSEVAITRLSEQVYYESEKPENSRDWAKPYHIKSKRVINKITLEKDSDIYNLIELGNISITPISWDFTARVDLEKYKLELAL